MILVKVRCHRCWTVLHEVEHRPATWDDPDLHVLRCRRCDLPDPRRIVKVMMRKDVDGIGLLAAVPWALLREPIELAERTGKTQDFGIRVLDRPNE